jgi:hypothetical protein
MEDKLLKLYEGGIPRPSLTATVTRFLSMWESGWISMHENENAQAYAPPPSKSLGRLRRIGGLSALVPPVDS